MQDLTSFFKDHDVMKINNEELFPTSRINPENTNIDKILKVIDQEDTQETMVYSEMLWEMV